MMTAHTSGGAPVLPSGGAPVLRMGWREWVLLGGLALVWGGSFFFNAVAVRELPALTIVCIRLGLAACVLWVFVLIRGTRLIRSVRLWLILAVIGLVNMGLPFLCIAIGQSYIASGLAAILNATTPVFGALVAHFIAVHEKLTMRRLAGVVIGFCGVAAMFGLDAQSLASGANLPAQLLVLCAALCYAFGGALSQRCLRGQVEPVTAACGQITCAAVLLTPFALVIDQPFRLAMPGFPVLLALAGIAVLSTALAYIVYFYLIGRVGVTNTLSVTLLVPVSAIAMGVAVLGEIIYLRHIVGLAIISLGLVTLDGRLLHLARRHAARALARMAPGRGTGRPGD